MTYHHKTLQVNYTTYDLWREQDTINPVTRADIMVLSHKDERSHPYWYACVIHIFHVMTQYHNELSGPFSAPKQMDVLFVCWFRLDINYPCGWSKKRLHQLQFFGQEGVHIIPVFGYYHSHRLLAGGSCRQQIVETDDPDADWKYYYINT